jgi:hypothetical protein
VSLKASQKREIDQAESMDSVVESFTEGGVGGAVVVILSATGEVEIPGHDPIPSEVLFGKRGSKTQAD